MIRSALLFVSAIALVVASACTKQNEASSEEKTAAPAAAKTVAEKTPTTNEATPVAQDSSEKTDCGSSYAAKGETEEAASDCSKEAGELGCNKWDAEAAAVLKNEVPKDASWLTYNVSGMKCGGCERRVIAKLGAIDGVVGVEADAELGQVRIATLPKNDQAIDQARETLNKLYKISEKI